MTRPLRVLSLSTLFPEASRPTFGIFVEHSMHALAAQPGIDLTIVAPVGVPPWPISALRRYAPRKVLPKMENWHGLSVLRPRWRIWPGIDASSNGGRVGAALKAAVRDLPPFDIIDAQFFHPDAVAAQVAAKALGLPYSVTARGSDIAIWARRPDTGPGIIAAAGGAGGLLAVSAALREDMIALGMPADRITVRRTGVDADRFHPMNRGDARQTLFVGDGPVLLTVGTLNANKGQHLVIDALATIPNATYLIAGSGPDDAALRARAESAGLSNRVRFLGQVPQAKLPQLYNAADIVVQPSSREGLANAWVEAMACGTPLIAADIAPAYEAIDSPESGRIVARTPAGIAAGVRDLIAAPPDRSALAARTHARFSWNLHGAAHAAHLRAIIERAKGDGSGGKIRKIALIP